MFAATNHGKQFQYDHCWNLLKEEKKWGDLGQNRMKASNSSPEEINLGHHSESSANQERPLGRKASKERNKKSKSSSSSEGFAMTEEFMKERLELERYKREQRDIGLAQGRERLVQEQQRINNEHMRWEAEMMGKDTSEMDAITAQYYNDLKREIMAKRGYNM